MSGSQEDKELPVAFSGQLPPPEKKQAASEVSVQLQEHLVLHSIISCLPLKTLFRFCSVSKSWRDTILSRNFHLSRRISDVNPAVCNFVHRFTETGQREYFMPTIHRVLGNISDPPELLSNQMPFGFEQSEYGNVRVSTLSCDGLLCVVVYSNLKRILLWNPYDRRCSRSIVMCPEASESYYLPKFYFKGFGYDASISDYKIVVMKSPTTTSGTWRIQVAAVKSDSWMELELSCSVPHNMMHTHGCFRPVTVEGDIYWIGKIKSDNSRHILKFNLKGETLTTIPLPKEMSEQLYTQIPLPELLKCNVSGRQMRVKLDHQNNKSLYLYYYNAYPRYSRRGSAMIEIWSHSKDIWTKVLSISETSFFPTSDCGIMRPLGFTAKGDFIISYRNHKYLAAYIPPEDKLKYFDIKYFDTKDSMILHIPFRKNMIAFVDKESSILP